MSKTKLKWELAPKTVYKDQLEQIKVKIISAPTMTQLYNYIPEFVMATWEDKPGRVFSGSEKIEIVRQMFAGKTLPTAMETIRITFRVEGLDLIDVTHLIRHRVFSFSAQCTGDRDMRSDDCMVKPSIMYGDFMDRYMALVNEAKDLYADMVDSREVSIFDARTVLPRSLSSFYYVSGNIKDMVNFIKTRKDEAIQPESDNVFAIRLYQELIKFYPMLEGTIDWGGTDRFWVESSKEGHSTMCYHPKKNNKFEGWEGLDYIYNKTRDDFIGSATYNRILREVK